MSLLNPPDVLPEAMRFIVRVLLERHEPVSEDELFRLVSPLGLIEATGGSEAESAHERMGAFRPSGRIIATKSLAVLRGAGLVIHIPGRHRFVTAANNVREQFPSWKTVTAAGFAQFIHEQVLAVTTDNLEDAETSSAAGDLIVAVALAFAIPNPLMPITGFEGDSRKTLADCQTNMLGTSPDSWYVRNSERFLPLQRWMTYLGLGRLVNLEAKGSVSLMVDPSNALAHLAPPLLRAQVPIGEFLEQLGSPMPYSDRGKIGALVRDRLQNTPESDHLSPGLAFGLQVLHLRKVINLAFLADAESWAFPITPAQPLRYSHIGPGVK